MSNSTTNNIDFVRQDSHSSKIEEDCTPPNKEFSFSLHDEDFEEELDNVKLKEKKQKKETSSIFDLAANTQIAPTIAAFKNETSAVSSVSGTSSVHSPYNKNIMEIFEKVSLMSLQLHESGDSETVILLDTVNSTSVFQGAEIIISEYSTAPKVFNVQINACAEAIALLQGQTSELINYVHEKRLPFQLGRVSTGLKEERAQRKRVEAAHEQDKQSLSDGSL